MSMKLHHQKQKQVRLILLLNLNIFALAFFSSSSLAQVNEDYRSQDIENIVFISNRQQPEPPNHGTPQTKRGTGSRGDCPHQRDTLPLTSLVGNGNLTKTTDEHPSFWIYIPSYITETSTAEFTLQDGDRDLYRSSIQIPEADPGIIEIKLPSTVASLETGKSYRWYFEINCSDKSNTNDLSAPDTLTGIVQKVELSPEAKAELNAAKNTLERIQIFAKYGIWHDTLTQTARLRLQNPHDENFQNLWSNLLLQPNIDLSHVASEPILEGVVQQDVAEEIP